MPRLVRIFIVASLFISASLLRSAVPAPTIASHIETRAVSAAVKATSTRAADAYGETPLTFEANRGQTDSRVKFISRGTGYTLFITDSETVFRFRNADSGLRIKESAALINPKSEIRNLKSAVLRMSFVGANPSTIAEAFGEVQTRSNYFVGSDPRKWLAGVPNYGGVRRGEIYPGVEVVYYGTQGRLEYDLRVAAGADTRRIKLRFDGADEINLSASGELVLRTAAGEVRQPKPVVYQVVDGAKKYIEGSYTLSRAGTVGFRLGVYDLSRELVIDPVLVYSTFLGGGEGDSADAIAVDAAGSAYVAGETGSLNFPVTAGARQTQLAGATDFDAFVTRLTPDGSSVVYSTYIGGTATDAALGIAIDTSGNAFVTGRTNSSNFPTTPGAFDTTCGNNGTCNDIAPTSVVQSDAFVLKLNPQGSDLVYSTYLGGSGTEPVVPPTNFPNVLKMGIAVDAAGSAYVTGTTVSQDFPTTPGAFQTTPGSSFVTKLNPTGTGLVYSTYFPGAMSAAIALDADGNAYIAGTAGDGGSEPKKLPVVNAYQATIGGQFTFDAFAAKLNASGTAVIFSTFLGGPEGAFATPRNGDDTGDGIGIDALGNIYVSGTTRSSCFPSSNPFVPPSDCPSGGAPKHFLAKFNPDGNTLLFSKKLNSVANIGGSLDVAATGISYAATACNNGQNFDVCVNGVAPNGQLVFSTVFGGSSDERVVGGVAMDAAGQIYVAGRTQSPDFPVTAAAFQKTFGGGFSDAFVAKLSPNASEAQLDSVSNSVNESQKKVSVRVDRSGDLTSEVTVDYATSDETASERSDYAAASGTLHFAPFETAKFVDIFITDDAFGPEGDETFRVTLSNPTGNASIGTKSATVVHILDNDTAAGPNPVGPAGFDTDFFVRQHYVDFLNREPDSSGYDFWKSEITNCGADEQCLEVKRINVSAAFFLSIEFQNTGYFVERMYKTAYGDTTSPNVAGTVPVIRLREFLPDTQKIGRGVVVGQTGWRPQLDSNKSAFALDFVGRTRFQTDYSATLTAEEFVTRLDQNAGGVLSVQEKSQLITELGVSPADAGLRASVLLKVADDADLQRNEFNRAFVLMQYFGYLRRDPNAAPDGDFRGWKFWLSKLEQFNGNFVRAEMVKAFISSDEYKRRFGS